VFRCKRKTVQKKKSDDNSTAAGGCEKYGNADVKMFLKQTKKTEFS